MFVLGVIAWFILYSIVGKKAYPGGEVFDLIALIVAAHIGGFLVSLTSLPRLIGMLATGIFVQVHIISSTFTVQLIHFLLFSDLFLSHYPEH